MKLNLPTSRGVGFNIYRKENGGEYTKLAKALSGESYVDATADPDKQYWYTAREFAYDKDGSEITGESTVSKTPDAPKVSVSATFDGVHLEWHPMDDAQRYTVIRFDSNGERTLIGMTDACSFDYRDLQFSAQVRYGVAVTDPAQENATIDTLRRYSPIGMSDPITLCNLPQVTCYECRDDGLYLEWTENPFADYYYVLGEYTTENHAVIKNINTVTSCMLAVKAYQYGSADGISDLRLRYPSVTYTAPNAADWELETRSHSYLRFNPDATYPDLIHRDYSEGKLTGYHGDEEHIVFPDSVLGMQNVTLKTSFEGSAVVSADIRTAGLTKLGAAFKDCKRLQTVTLSPDIASLQGTFEGCSALEIITIPASVTAVRDGCFKDCTGLRRIVFEPDSQISLITPDAFEGCDGLTVYGYGSGTYAEAFARENGFLYVDMTKPMIGDADGDMDVTVMDVTAIQYSLAEMYTPLSDALLMRGDIDRSGDVGIDDAAFILRHPAGMETPFPIGAA